MNSLTKAPSDKGDFGIIKKVMFLARSYHELLNEPNIDTKAVIKNRGDMTTILEKVRATKKPELILLAESAILQTDKRHLDRYVNKEVFAGHEISREIKVDLTQLNDGIKAMDDSLTVFRLRRKFGEEAYHEISVGSRQQKATEVDKNKTAIDVLRKNSTSHETRLRNMASASSNNEMGRMNQYVYGVRRQNMTCCRELYASHQKEFIENHTKNREIQ